MEKPKLTKFVILGERCSGTTFVQYAISRNFNIHNERILGKHFFGHDNSVFKTKEMKETLVICVFRKPVDWIDSFFKRLHNVPSQNKQNIQNFINNEFYSIYEIPPIGEELMEDRHIYEKRRYRNIFELRKTKNHFLLSEIPTLVDNYLFLRYEDMRDNYEETLDKIQKQYGLERYYPEFPYEKIVKYKGTYNAEYFLKPILLEPEVKEEILKRVDKEQEETIANIEFTKKSNSGGYRDSMRYFYSDSINK